MSLTAHNADDGAWDMPGQPLICSDWVKTQETGYRLGWRGKLILQIKEVQKTGRATGNGPNWTGERGRWRDAGLMDFAQLPTITHQ